MDMKHRLLPATLLLLAAVGLGAQQQVRVTASAAASRVTAIQHHRAPGSGQVPHQRGEPGLKPGGELGEDLRRPPARGHRRERAHPEGGAGHHASRRTALLLHHRVPQVPRPPPGRPRHRAHGGGGVRGRGPALRGLLQRGGPGLRHVRERRGGPGPGEVRGGDGPRLDRPRLHLGGSVGCRGAGPALRECASRGQRGVAARVDRAVAPRGLRLLQDRGHHG